MRLTYKLVAIAASLAIVPSPLLAHDPAEEMAAEELAPGVEELRHVIGEWSVTTEYLNDDGSVAGALDGTYTFEWVVADKVVQGVATTPSINQTSAMMFYLRPAENEIEMVSVGADGQLWPMTGTAGGDVRQTPVVAMPDGTTIKLRFTRYNVQPDSFESRMERSSDGGETWLPGNHQLFTRASS